MALHTTVVLVVPAFLALFWWQVQRVREGNTLSWAYVFEWPFFTGYAVYLWWKLVHDQPGMAASTGAPGARGTTGVSSAPSAPGAPCAPGAPGAPLAGEVAHGGQGGDDVAGSAAHGACSPAGVTDSTHALGAAAAGRATPTADASRDEPDDELAAYNRYLAELNASGRRKSW
jgi:hypothetical protein